MNKTIPAILFLAAAGTSQTSLAYTVYWGCGNGEPLKWKTNEVHLRASTQFDNPPWKRSLATSIARWNQTPSSFRFTVHYGDNNVALGNGQNEILWVTSLEAPAATITLYSCSGGIRETDILFNVQKTWTTSMSKRSLISYGGTARPFQTTAIHELGHAAGLLHTSGVYNIMGADWTHIFSNGRTAKSYVGEDAVNGVVSMYGLASVIVDDVSVTHWRHNGNQGLYSTHGRTRLFDNDGQVLNSYLHEGEPVFLVSRGERVQPEFTYENNGAYRQAGINLDFYISTNDYISRYDRKIGDDLIQLGRDIPLTRATLVQIPYDLTSGKIYYLGVLMDGSNNISEIREDNNATYIAIQIR